MINDISKSDRQTILDILKGICIIFVIVTHYDWSDKQRLLGLFPYIIDMAVPIFMIISGYVFSASYLRKGIDRFEDAYDLEIIIKRLIRYTNPFIIAYIIELTAFYIAGKPVSIYDAIKGLFIGGYGPGSYYYPEMIQITFFFPIILFSVRKNPRAGLVFWFLFNAFYELLVPIVEIDTRLYRMSLFRHSFLVAFGCFFYLRRQKRMSKIGWGVSFLIGVLYIFVTRYLGYQPKIINSTWRGTSYMAALYVAPVVMIIINKFCKCSFKPLEQMGKASYNIFLTQLVYYSTVSSVISNLLGSTFTNVVINVLVCVLVGMAFYIIENTITNRMIKGISPILYRIKSLVKLNE